MNGNSGKWAQLCRWVGMAGTQGLLQGRGGGSEMKELMYGKDRESVRRDASFDNTGNVLNNLKSPVFIRTFNSRRENFSSWRGHNYRL